ncbi:M1 family metallopeptidase [Streptomyces sp. NPDC059477]|uniref:M1 family metallopeptidase n=1 Tax=Streptomyces sp. NPDC059477 TaxID=3346847 RepID=UPI00369D99F8
MSRSARLLAAVLGCVALLASMTGGAPPGKERHTDTRTPASAAYTVELAGDSSGGQWSGHERVSFTNVSADPLREVFLRLWGNAHGGCAAPAVTVTHLAGATADGLHVGCTALRLALPTPLGPGERHTIDFDLTVRAPELADNAGRFGRHGAYSHFGNALPLLAVRDTAGWHLAPFTDTGESFYTLAADFTVALDHPATIVVPATGSTWDTPGTTGRTVTTATARKVRDFAWSAGPFDTVSQVMAGGVTIKVHSGAGITAADTRAMLAATGSAMDTHARAFGAYPYPELDVVLDNDLWFSGMEYPGFVLNRVKTSALIHEIAHQWWYGIVGDDQYHQPWLDESFAEYATELALGRDGSDCWRAVEWTTPQERITNGMAYWDEHPARYEDVVYTYGACALHDLRRTIGADAMTRLLHDYVRTHRYGVSTTPAFKAAAQSATTKDLTPFWTTHRIDD